MSSDGPVARFCEWMWNRREAGSAFPAHVVVTISRELALACANQVRVMEDYDPEEDVRVRWARGVLMAARRGEAQLRAAVDLEAAMEFLRRPSGKMLAAGGIDR